MAKITVAKSPFGDAMHREARVSLDDTYPDGHLIMEVEDEGFWGKDPALKYELQYEFLDTLEEENPYLN